MMRQREAVSGYLSREPLEFGEVGEWAAWYVPPLVTVWAVESLRYPGQIGWWVIAGDLPTDYCSSAEVEPPQHPRKAVRVFAERWRDMAAAWSRGEPYGQIEVGGAPVRPDLAPLLASRSDALLRWVADDGPWEDR